MMLTGWKESIRAKEIIVHMQNTPFGELRLQGLKEIRIEQEFLYIVARCQVQEMMRRQKITDA